MDYAKLAWRVSGWNACEIAVVEDPISHSLLDAIAHSPPRVSVRLGKRGNWVVDFPKLRRGAVGVTCGRWRDVIAAPRMLSYS